jgi:hypothetical protein
LVLRGFELFKLFFAILLGLPLFVPFVGFTVFLLLNDHLELFLAFGFLAMLYGVLDSNFKLCAFCYQCTHQGGD